MAELSCLSDMWCITVPVPMKQAPTAAIAQLGERQTEDLKVPGSIPGLGTLFSFCVLLLACFFAARVVSQRVL